MIVTLWVYVLSLNSHSQVHQLPLSVYLKLRTEVCGSGCDEKTMVMDSLAAELAAHLIPSHLRVRRGGRLPAPDPRTNRKLSQPQAQRILKNRLSAARSKLCSKTV